MGRRHADLVVAGSEKWKLDALGGCVAGTGGVVVKTVPSGPVTVHCQFGCVGVEDPQAMVPFTVRVRCRLTTG